jgi:hypothetical protein
MIHMLHDLLGELEKRSGLISSMNLRGQLADLKLDDGHLNVANTAPDLDRVARAIEGLSAAGSLGAVDADKSMKRLLSPLNFYGEFCELGAYDWLLRNGVKFQAQVALTGADVLNPNGSIIDGAFTTLSGFFDIKAMGFQEYVADQFRKRLEGMLSGLRVSVTGSMDIAVKEIETVAFAQLSSLAQQLKNGGVRSLPQLGWIIRAEPPRPVAFAERTTDPYRLAAENVYYPFKAASQFATRKPFIQLFAYCAQFNHPLSANFARSTEIMLRALARRAFIQVTNDTAPVQSFDQRAPTNITLGAASRLLSALLFINLDTDHSWLFLNPRATFRLTRDDVERLFDFTIPMVLGIDDFVYDDY